MMIDDLQPDDRVAAALASSSDLSELGPRHLATMASFGHEVNFASGKAVVRIGEPADRFWVVIEGTIDVELHVPVAGTIPLTRLGPGAVLGVSWVAPPHVFELDATTVTDVLAVEIDAVALRDRCATDPELGRDLYQRFSGLLRDRLHATRILLLDLYRTAR